MKKYSMESVVGIFVVIGLLCLGYMAVKLGKVSLFGEEYYSLYARFSSVSGLRNYSTVEIDGIEVGRVERLTLDQDKQMALVQLKIKKGIKVYDDSSASIKIAGLIGDKFVEIHPGGGCEILKPGGTITETTTPTDIEELISKYVLGDVKKDDKDYSVHTGREFLIDKHHTIEKELEKSPSAVPFYIESSVNNDASVVDVYGTIEYPFGSVQSEFLVPTNWCKILLSNMNIRACTYTKVNDTWLLNDYKVNEFAEPLKDAYQMKFEYHVNELQSRYFHILLNAPEGPFQTKDHRVELEAIPLSRGRTFIHLRYSFSYSALVYLALKLSGGGKTGFTVVGTDSNGNPVYVGGLRGEVERTVVCYYLANLAYMDTLKVPAERRFEKRISRWYDLASRYKKQLIEMDKEEYFTSKRQDRTASLILQDELNK
jgi:phospholipid/cholesterol/gamma-HCH transport system substrate-binding protein